MKFILQLWPECDDNTPPQELLRSALGSIRDVPGLVWDIADDDGEILYDNVSVEDE